MTPSRKNLFLVPSVATLFLLLFSIHSFGGDEIVFGPQEFKISPWHFHLSYHTFSVAVPCEGLLLLTKQTTDKNISGGLVLLNDHLISIQDFLRGSEEFFEKNVDLRSRNYLVVFLSGTPEAALSMEVRGTSTFDPKPEVQFTGDPLVIKPGDTSTLQWTTAYAENIWIDQGIGAVEQSGSLVVCPGETVEYCLTASGEGGSTTKSVKIEVREGLGIVIASPSEGETTGKSHVLVKGTFDAGGAIEVGINVNGVVALVYGGEFAANGVPLEEGENQVTAVVVDANGNRQETSVKVYMEPGRDDLTIKAQPESGIAALETNLKVESSFDIGNPSFSYSGPGVVEFLENTETDQYAIKMSTPGLYTIAVEVTDDDGRLFIDTVAVLVIDGEMLDGLLKEKWNGMKNALIAGDTGKAVGYIAQGERDRYEYNFNILGAYLGEISAGLNGIEVVQVRDRIAEYEMWAEQDGQTHSFYVLFVKDQDGIWRIEFF